MTQRTEPKMLNEGEFVDVANKAVTGDKVGAVASLAGTLVTSFTGHPLLGALSSASVSLLAKAILDGATKRLTDAEREWDSERDRALALQRLLREAIEPLFASQLSELTEQSREQFLQILRYLDRNVASAAGQEQLLRLVDDIKQRLEKHAVNSVHDLPDLEELLGTGISKPPAQRNPASLLNARYRFVPFYESGRRELLEDLRRWCDDPEPVRARLLVGPGGVGKTRLLIEFCERLRARQWGAGFLSKRASKERFHALVRSTGPALIVLDYAESRSDLGELLSAVAARRNGNLSGTIRVVLLARTAGAWWTSVQEVEGSIRDLLAGDPVTVLDAVAPCPADREEAFRQARKALAATTGVTEPTTPVPSLDDPSFDRVLFLHMAALQAVVGLQIAPSRLLDDTLEHEERFWVQQTGLVGDRAKQVFTEQCRSVVAAVTLVGGAPPETLTERMRHAQIPLDEPTLGLLSIPHLSQVELGRWSRAGSARPSCSARLNPSNDEGVTPSGS
jgi:hypothetical protein